MGFRLRTEWKPLCYVRLGLLGKVLKIPARGHLRSIILKALASRGVGEESSGK